MPIGILIKGTIMTHATMMIRGNTEITEVTLMNKTSGNTVTGSGSGSDLKLTGTMKGGPLSGARVLIPDGHKAQENLRHRLRDCRVTLRGGFTADPQSEAVAAVHFLHHAMKNRTKPVWSAMQKLRKQKKREPLTKRGLTKTDAWPGRIKQKNLKKIKWTSKNGKPEFTLPALSPLRQTKKTRGIPVQRD